MNDTHPGITLKVKEMMAKKTGEERLKMGCSMYELSKQLVISSIMQQNPDASPTLVHREVFLRFYGQDFDSKSREKIINHLMQRNSR